MKCDVIVDDIAHYRQATKESFGLSPMTVEIRREEAPGRMRERTVRFMADQQKRKWCFYTRRRPLFESADADECYMHHVGWELDILAQHVEKRPNLAGHIKRRKNAPKKGK